MRIQCSKCRRRISVDEAFAGGVCRCPYCSAVVFVADGARRSDDRPRPVSPTARPETPEQEPQEALAAAAADAKDRHDAPTPVERPKPPAEAEQVPMASPVRIQGIVTIVLIVLVLGMVAVGVVLALRLIDDPTPAPETLDTQPIAAGPEENHVEAAAQDWPKGVTLKSPVVFCLDAGSSMGDVLDYARAMIRLSVRGMKAEEKFNVLLCVEPDRQGAAAHRWLLDDYTSGGPAAEKALVDALEAIDPLGATKPTAALAQALKRTPATIVLLARKSVGDTREVAESAVLQSTRIVTAALDGDDEANGSLARLAGATGGQVRAWPIGRLERWAETVAESLE